jgi:UDP-N-acetylmuramoylalanine--D-glutamate ligase
MKMDIADKKVVVVGFGKTGRALARFLVGRKAKVTVSEIRQEKELGIKTRSWREKGVAFELGRHQALTFHTADLIIPSPGAAALPELASARAAGVRVLSEIELASCFLKGRVVGITGTNGKSTTAALAHKILEESGLKSFLAGNIGTPLISFAERSRDDHVYVTEVSSFQLEYVDQFKPDVSVFLNFSLNHLDWHASFDEYFAAKKRMFLTQGADDIAILNADDRLVRRLAAAIRPKAYLFSRRKPVRRGCFLRKGWIILKDEAGEERLMKAAEIPLPGLHNLENTMAASVIGRVLGVDPRSMRASIRSFPGLEHRLEKVLTLRGVNFVNDSKATTVDSTVKALQSFDRPVVLILGGRDKGADFRLLRPSVRQGVKRVILLGEAKEKIARALRGVVPMVEAPSLSQAVRQAFAAASPGEVVLLAPACTSFDMFRNFEARGRAFKREVRVLAESLSRRKV